MADERIKVSAMDALASIDDTQLIMVTIPGSPPYKMTVGELKTYLSTVNANIIELGVKSADFVYSVAANSKILSIDYLKISGTPVIKVGTTLGGEEVIMEDTITSRTDNSMVYPIATATDLYFAVSGGSVKINIWLLLNYFS